MPGMGMILWGASPLYIFQEGDEKSTLKKVLAEGKGVRVTDRLKEAGVQTCELTNRNRI